MRKELYKFVEGSNVWTVTSSDADEDYNGETYVSTTIGRNEAESKNELSRANLEVSFDLDSPIARRWMREVIDSVVTLSIFSKDVETSSVMVVWKGRLSSVKPDVTSITLVFESIFTSLRRAGLRKRYQRSCPHVLYGRGCRLNKDDWKTSGVVGGMSANGLIVSVGEAATFPDGYFTAGMIEAPDGTLRFITNHVGSTLTLIRPVYSLSEAFANSGYGYNYGNFYGSVVVNIYPGCDRSKETCNDKFSNLLNYGGYPFIPLKNPFGGSSIV